MADRQDGDLGGRRSAASSGTAASQPPTDEEHVRRALRRLNPEFHTSDYSWVALDHIMAREARLRDVLQHGVAVALQYLDTGRGDLDGWAALAADVSGGTPEAAERLTPDSDPGRAALSGSTDG